MAPPVLYGAHMYCELVFEVGKVGSVHQRICSVAAHTHVLHFLVVQAAVAAAGTRAIGHDGALGRSFAKSPSTLRGCAAASMHAAMQFSPIQPNRRNQWLGKWRARIVRNAHICGVTF